MKRGTIASTGQRPNRPSAGRLA